MVKIRKSVIKMISKKSNMTFKMPNGAVSLEPTFGEAIYTVDIVSEGQGATGAGSYAPGKSCRAFAGYPPENRTFQEWRVYPDVNIYMDNPTSMGTGFLMPSEDITLTAIWQRTA